jgi:hypothetical protein
MKGSRGISSVIFRQIPFKPTSLLAAIHLHVDLTSSYNKPGIEIKGTLVNYLSFL